MDNNNHIENFITQYKNAQQNRRKSISRKQASKQEANKQQTSNQEKRKMAGFITTEQFKTLSTENRKRKMNDDEAAIPWRDLPLHKLYKIEHTKDYTTANNFNDSPSMIIKLSDEESNIIKVWASGRLGNDLRENHANDKTNLYVKSLGRKEGKQSGRFTYEYDLAQASPPR